MAADGIAAQKKSVCETMGKIYLRIQFRSLSGKRCGLARITPQRFREESAGHGGV